MVLSAEPHGYRLELAFLAGSTATERDKSKGRGQVQEACGCMEDGYISDFLRKVLDRL